MQTALLSYVILSHPSVCKIKRKDQFHTDSELRHQKSVAGETCVCRQSRETFQSQVPHSLSSISDVLGTTVPDRVTGDYLHKQKLTSESCSVELMSTYPACEIQIQDHSAALNVILLNKVSINELFHRHFTVGTLYVHHILLQFWYGTASDHWLI